MDAETCHVFWWLVVALVFGIFCLLLHHKFKHSDPSRPKDFKQDECEQWFQWRLYPRGDVCNFTTCSHEMWILFFILLSVLIVVMNVAGGCLGELHSI